TIGADAVTNGDGGKVVVWADGKTSYFGEISARGGANGGDGGFVEVSGKKSLTFAGKVDTRAPQGKTGTLLLDPTNIEIVGNAHPDLETLDPADVDEFGDPDLFDPPDSNGDTKIGILALETAATGSNVVLQAENDITFSEPVNMLNINSGISAQAGNDITVNQSITTLGGDILFSANDAGATAPTGTGSVNINAAINTNGGSFTSSGDNFNNTGGTITATGGITISNDKATLAADLDSGAGLLEGTVDTVNVNLSGSIQDGIDIAANNATVTVGDGIFTEDLTISNVSGLTLESENGMAAATVQLIDGVGIDIQGSADGFTLGGGSDDGFTILSGGATTFLTQLANAPSNVTISNNTLDTTGNASMAISIGAAGATDLTISYNTINVTDAGDGGIWGPEVTDIDVSNNILNGPGAYGIQFSGVRTDDGTSIISGNIINGFTGSGGIVISNGGGTSDLAISNNTVTNSTYGLRIAEYSPVAPGDMTTVTVSDNNFSGNDKAVRIGDGVHILSSNFVISNNDLSNSTTAGLDFDHTTEIVDVTNSWWGSADGPEIASNKFNTGSHGVVITEVVPDSVIYTPWLDGPGGNPFAPVTNVTRPTPTYHSSIEAGIAGAIANDELQIETGFFDEDVIVDRDVRLRVDAGDMAMMYSMSSNVLTNTGLAGDFMADDPAAAFTFNGTVSLEDNVSLTSISNGSLTFNDNVTDSDSSILAIDTGIGGIDLNANITANGGLGLNGGIINIGDGIGADKVTSNGAVVINATGTVTINAEIDPTTVHIASTDNIDIAAAVTADDLIDIRAGTDNTGGVSIEATGSLETVNAGSDINVEAGQPGGSGSIALDGLVKAVDQVILTAHAGAIEETGIGSGSTKIEAAGATLTAETNIGVASLGGQIDTKLGTLTAAAKNSIVISNTGNITLADVKSTVNGDVFVTNSAGIIAEDVAAAGLGRMVGLAGDDIEVHAISASDTVMLIATGSITDGDNSKKITTNNLDMNAAAAIGADGAEIDTEVTTLLNAIANGGGIYLSETDGLTINNINANGGNDNVKIINANEQGIGLGDAVVVGGLNISGVDLGNIHANVLELVSNNAGVINIDNIVPGDDATITALKLTAGDVITFENNPSTINVLTADAGNKIDVDVELQTDVGDLVFESAFDAAHNLTAAGDMTLKGAGVLDGTVASQDQVISAVGTLLAESTLTKNTTGELTLSGGTGAVLKDDVVVNDGGLTITSDVDAERLLKAVGLVHLQGVNNNLAGNVTGIGITFDNAVTADGVDQTFDAGTGILLAQAINKTTVGKLTLGGNTDITLAGNVTSGDDITLDDNATATGGVQTIDAGAGTLSAQAINKTTAGKLTLGGNTDITLAGDVTSNDDITLADNATATGGVQTIDAGAGTLSAQAINKTTAGKLTLGGNTDIALAGDVTSNDDITLADNATATGGTQTIDAGAGTLSAKVITKTTAGKLTLGGNTDITLAGNVTSNDDITIADNATATGGVQTIDAGAGILSAKSIRKTTAGKLTLGGNTDISLTGNVTSNSDITLADDATATGGAQAIDAGAGTLTAKVITKTTTGKLTLGGNSNIVLAGNVTSGDDITLDDDATAIGGVQIIDAGDGKLAAEVITKTTTGKLTLGGDTDIALAGDVTSNDDITLEDDATAIGGVQTFDAGAGILSAQVINKTTTGKLTLGGDTNIILAGDITSNDDITIADGANAIGGVQTFSAGAGKLEARSSITKTSTGGLTLSGRGGVELASIVDVQAGGLTVTDVVDAEGLLQATGAVELQNTANLADNVSGGSIKFVGAVTADGGSGQTFDAGAGKLGALNTITKNNGGGLTLSGRGGVELASMVDVQTGELTVTDAVDAEGLLQASGAVELQNTA
ncbi:MAG: hypothetical protein KAT56_03385, partial [Sedimentisphaerales bacterium]|nr:hypothetical protein [Sedimentisphaerales bacterium]